jgi:cytochrome c5
VLCLLLAGAAAQAAAPGPRAAPAGRDYAAACGACHENNGYAVQRIGARVGADRARLSRRCDLDAAALRAVVRNGILAMPPMSRAEVSDAELDGIVRELTLRAECGR